MTNNLIQWPKAVYWTKTYNPIIGCQKISPACQNCYAKAWADRFNVSFAPHESTKKKPPKTGICFCGNVTDLFGDWCDSINPPEVYIGEALKQKNDATYLWLTKRPKRMCRALRSGYDRGDRVVSFAECDMSNHYFGFTAENQEWFDNRIREFTSILPHAFLWWVSAEPLLGNINLHKFRPDWLVVGAESGSKRRECKIEWIESIVEQCHATNIPVFVKQLDIDGKCETDITKFPKHLQIRQVPWMKEEELLK